MPTKKQTCFVIMPISTPKTKIGDYGNDEAHFKHVLENLFIPAITMAGYEPISPSATGSEIIQAGIIENLAKADLVLCDLSILNANVFFEYGIRTALNLPVAIVADNLTVNIPFDVHMINRFEYDSAIPVWSIEEQIKDLSVHLVDSMSRSLGKNALWKFFGISISSHLATESVSSEDKLSVIVQQLESLSQQMVTINQTKDRPNILDAIQATRMAQIAQIAQSEPRVGPWVSSQATVSPYLNPGFTGLTVTPPTFLTDPMSNAMKGVALIPPNPAGVGISRGFGASTPLSPFLSGTTVQTNKSGILSPTDKKG